MRVLGLDAKMKGARTLAVLAIGFAACLLPAQSIGLSVGQDRSMDEWRKTFRDYSKQSADSKAQILRELPEFSKRFLELVKQLTEVKSEQEFTLWVSGELDNLLAAANPPLLKEDIEVLKQKVGALHLKADKFIKENPSSKGVTRSIAGDFTRIVRQGLNDMRMGIRIEAEHSFQLLLDQRFRAKRVGYRRRCGTRSELADHQDILNDAVSNLLREQVKEKPLAMFKVLRNKGTGFKEILLAMAEAKNPLVRPIIADLVQSKAADEVDLGLHCVINWPIPEALPWVIDKVTGNGDEDGYVLQTALVCFGEKGLRSLAQKWKSIHGAAVPLIFEALGDIPSQAALTLLSEGVRDARPEVRAESAKALGSLLDAEWWEFYAGPNPRNLDRKRILWLLNKLARDSDESVRAAATSALSSVE